jgi:hypothetical protein
MRVIGDGSIKVSHNEGNELCAIYDRTTGNILEIIDCRKLSSYQINILINMI